MHIGTTVGYREPPAMTGVAIRGAMQIARRLLTLASFEIPAATVQAGEWRRPLV